MTENESNKGVETQICMNVEKSKKTLKRRKRVNMKVVNQKLIGINVFKRTKKHRNAVKRRGTQNVDNILFEYACEHAETKIERREDKNARETDWNRCFYKRRKRVNEDKTKIIRKEMHEMKW